VDSGSAAISVDDSVRFQSMDGFGFCEAFQRARIMRGSRGLTPANQRAVLDLLFSPTDGAGLSMLRLGIGSSADDVYDHMRSIATADPGGPDVPLTYEWDSDDAGQLWLARRAHEYGVRQFYACAWSCPGFMMSNRSDIGGGVLCGLPGAPQDRGDWRPAYAEYLLEYLRCYRREGIKITHLGFVNEPDLFLVKKPHEIPYAAMQMSPDQVVDFAKLLGQAIDRSGIPVSVVCCDAASWAQQAVYTSAIEHDPDAARAVAVHAGHNYYEAARWRLPTERRVWMSEWEPDVEGNVWRTAWDAGLREDGMRLAEDIHGALTEANVSAYLYWFGASVGGTRALIRLDGQKYNASKRLWALAGFSRFVRPGATRMGAFATDPQLKVSVFLNTDGLTVLNVINTSGREVTASLHTESRPVSRSLTAYVTDDQRSMARMPTVHWPASCPVARFPARSMTCLVGL